MKELDLLDAIAREPDSIDRYLVYGDWLSQQGDPRGELIALQVALTRSPGERRLRASEERLLRDQGESLLGPCANLARPWSVSNRPVLTIEWRYGFIRSARFEGTYDPEHHDTIYGRIKRSELLEALLRHPSSRFIERLEIGDWWVARDLMFDAEMFVLTRAPKTLRSVTVAPRGDRDIGGRLFSLERFLAAHPQLVELDLGGESVSLPREIELPRLEKLALLEHRPSSESFEAITGNRWPRLSVLSISSSRPYGGELGPILSGDGFPRLESLTLRGAIRATWPVMEAIARSPMLRRLRRLDLSRCLLDDFGVQGILRHRDAFAHLRMLNLDGNELSEEAVDAVREVACEVLVGTQRGIHFG